jgi:hypothetical protein
LKISTGAYVWELKWRYPDEETEREQYNNGMAVSHVGLLLTGDRCHEWVDVDELRDTVDKIPETSSRMKINQTTTLLDLAPM